jgi:hypothetical protein
MGAEILALSPRLHTLRRWLKQVIPKDFSIVLRLYKFVAGE